MHGKTSMVSMTKARFSGPDAIRWKRGVIIRWRPKPTPARRTASYRAHRARRDHGVRHRELPMEGVQFHPESVLTPEGDRLLENFLALRAD